MSDTDAATMAKCLPWLARVIEDELIPLLRELRDRLPREAKPAPSAFAQPELPGIVATPPAEAAMPITVAPHDSAELPDGLVWTNDLPPTGEIARKVAAMPRRWCNSVKVYDLICGTFAIKEDFRLGTLAQSESFVKAMRDKTGSRVGIASLSRILSTCVRAAAIVRKARDLYYIPAPPSDAARERIEAVARKSNDHGKERVA